MEAIIEKAFPRLEENSDPKRMEDDWVTNFFDKSRIISDSEMQDLWASVLAGEVNSPGTYSKRTVNFLGDLDKKDAELFLALCRFGWIFNPFTPRIFDVHAPIYNKTNINFSTLTHMDSIGLIQFNNVSGFSRTGLQKTFTVTYCGEPLNLTMEKDNRLYIGVVLLSQVGRELSLVCQASGVDGFVDYVKKEWIKYLPENESTEHSAPADR